MKIPTKFQLPLIIGTCIEIIIFAITVLYILKEGRAGAALGMLINLPFSILGMACNNMIQRMEGNINVAIVLMSLITFMGQSALWSMLFYAIQKLIKVFKSSIRRNTGN